MESESRRDRLARLHLERLNRPPDQGWTAWADRAVDRWERFMAGSGWERAFFAGGVVLIAALAIGAIFMIASNALGGGSGRKQAAAGGARATATIAQAPPTPTAIVIGVPTLPTALPTDRASCDAIRGTNYKSAAERQFFELNCVTPTAQPTRSPGNGHGGPPTQPPPPPTQPPPSGGFTAGDAIDLAVYWITHNAAAAYTTDAGSCNAVQTGSHWVVTCNASVVGCQGSACQTTLSVCVFPDPLAVRPADQC